MKRADDLTNRLAYLFTRPPREAVRFHVVEGPGEVIIEETAKEGYARVVCELPPGFLAVQWHHEPGDLRPLTSEENADGAVLIVRPDGALEAHVMECKQTIDSAMWRKARRQLEWTAIRMLAITGAMHERVERIVLYTVFRTDALSIDRTADAELLELALDDARANPIVRRDLEWMRPEVTLPGWTTRFEHVRVQKDERGHATVDLCV